MSTTDDTHATRRGSGSNDLLGPGSEAVEMEALRALAVHAKFEAAMFNACDGSMLAQKAACLEWLACGAEYRDMLRGGGCGGDLLAAEKELVKQIGYLAKNWA
jgi:hypothetical protein